MSQENRFESVSTPEQEAAQLIEAVAVNEWAANENTGALHYTRMYREEIRQWKAALFPKAGKVALDSVAQQ